MVSVCVRASVVMGNIYAIKSPSLLVHLRLHYEDEVPVSGPTLRLKDLSFYFIISTPNEIEQNASLTITFKNWEPNVLLLHALVELGPMMERRKLRKRKTVTRVWLEGWIYLD